MTPDGRTVQIQTAEVVLVDLAPGVLEASVAEVLDGLTRTCHEIAEAQP